MTQIMSVVVQEIGSSNLVDPGRNFHNVLQISQNPQIIGFLRGLMPHQVLQNVISSQNENPTNPD